MSAKKVRTCCKRVFFFFNKVGFPHRRKVARFVSRKVYLVDLLGDGVHNCKNLSVPSLCDGEFQPQLQNNSGKVCLLIAQKAADTVFYYQRVLVK